jgi:hypothetical protein
VSEPLPELLDAKHLAAELGVTRAAAEPIMRRLPIVSIEGLRKTYVRREHVRRYLEERTFSKDRVPGVRGPDEEEKLSTTPRNRPARRLVWQVSTTPLAGGEDA